MKEKTKVLLWRFLRTSVAVVLAGLAVKYGESNWYLAVAPLLLTLDKWVRWE
jgi:hypothetical protein